MIAAIRERALEWQRDRAVRKYAKDIAYELGRQSDYRSDKDEFILALHGNSYGLSPDDMSTRVGKRAMKLLEKRNIAGFVEYNPVASVFEDVFAESSALATKKRIGTVVFTRPGFIPEPRTTVELNQEMSPSLRVDSAEGIATYPAFGEDEESQRAQAWLARRQAEREGQSF